MAPGSSRSEGWNTGLGNSKPLELKASERGHVFLSSWDRSLANSSSPEDASVFCSVWRNRDRKARETELWGLSHRRGPCLQLTGDMGYVSRQSLRTLEIKFKGGMVLKTLNEQDGYPPPHAIIHNKHWFSILACEDPGMGLSSGQLWLLLGNISLRNVSIGFKVGVFYRLLSLLNYEWGSKSGYDWELWKN